MATINGTSGDDTLNGTSGADTISGVGGNDTISGNGGGDTINGGDGDDTLSSGAASLAWSFPYYGNPFTPPVFDHGTEIDSVNGGAGDDVIFAGYGDNVDGGDQNSADRLLVSFQAATSGVTFDAHLTTQVIGGGTITGIELVSWVEGSNYGDYIDVGSDIYSDSVAYGMAGDDTLIAGGATILLDGGDGNDVLDGRGSPYYLQELDGGAGDDTLYSSMSPGTISNGGDGNDTIYAANNVNGGNGNDTVYLGFSYYTVTANGDAGDDQIHGSFVGETLNGGEGNDTLDGAGGNDILDGGAGADLLIGGAGYDTLTGGADNDTFLFQQGDGKDTITDFAVGDTLEVNGYESAQSITQVGSDVVVAFSSDDQVTLSNTDVATVEAGLQFAGPSDDVLVGGADVDYLRGFGGNDTLSGNDGGDTLVGGSGLDVIDGGNGADTLYSGNEAPQWGFPYYGNPYTPPVLDQGAEVDTLNGGADGDVIFAGYGDNVDGGSGSDALLVSFQGADSGISFDINLGTQTIGGGTITGIEEASWVEGSNYDDYINVHGGSGVFLDSVVYGMGGNDTLIAGYYTVLLDGGDGNDFIDGTSSGYLQEVDGGAGDDTIYTEMSPNTVVNGGDGNDTIHSAGETHGGDGNDTIQLGFSYYGATFNEAYGDGGDDQLEGSASHDTLVGGTGNDTLTGHGGNDIFKYAPGDGNDVITDFSAGDSLQVNGYEALQSITQVGSDVVLVFSATDQITFQNTDVATVEAGITYLVTNDTIVGGPGDDTLNGYGGDDFVAGGGGSDTVNGGSGNDSLYADELYFLDTSADHDVVIGGSGDDYLYVGFGDDVDGGEGNDSLWLNFHGADAGVTLDTAELISGQPVTIGGGTIQGIEQIKYIGGSAFADTLTVAGQAAAVTLDAGDGDDLITWQLAGGEVYGESGNDTVAVLHGGSVAFFGAFGDDTLISGAGADWFAGYSGSDTIDYRNAAVGIVASLAVGVASDGDSFNEVENINGSGFADTLSGDNFANVLRGGDGDDTLSGARGNDTLEGGAGNDLFEFTVGDGKDVITDFASGDTLRVIDYGAAQSITQVGADVVVILSPTDQITFQNTTLATVQAGLQFVVDPPQTITGTAGDDWLVGGSGNDTLSGGAGNDQLEGRFGADTLIGGSGNDLFFVDNAGDVVIEGRRGGTDTVITYVDYTLAAGVQVEELDAGIPFGAALVGNPINLTGNEFVQTLVGNGNDNVLLGMAGNDTLIGGDGEDTLNGGAGNDVLTGGWSGADLFLYGTGGGRDIITDFSSGDVLKVSGYTAAQSIVQSATSVIVTFSRTDKITLQNTDVATVQAGLQFASGGGGGGTGGGGTGGATAGDDVINGTSASDTLHGLDGNDTLLGLAGGDSLFGDGGNDTLRGGLGADILTGGTGADLFVFEARGGNDKITDFVSGTDKIDLHLLNTDASAMKTAISGSNLLVSVDADHNGRADFTITLIGVNHVDPSDFIFG